MTPKIWVRALIAASTVMKLGLVRWWLVQDPSLSLAEMVIMPQKVQSQGIWPLLSLGGER